MSRLLEDPRLKTMVVECNPAGLARVGATSSELVNLLAPSGFSVCKVDEVKRSLLPVDATLANVKGFVNL